jgi:anti-sigma B factor antagonist
VIVSTCDESAADARPVFVPRNGFHITVSAYDAEPVIRITGDLDARTASLFDRAYDEASDHAPARVIVDLSHMDFIDSTGLRSIVRARARAADRAAFVLRDPQRGTVRILELSGLLDEFTIESTA